MERRVGIRCLEEERGRRSVGRSVGGSGVSSASPSRRSRDMAGNEAARRLHAQFEAPIAEGNEEGKQGAHRRRGG